MFQKPLGPKSLKLLYSIMNLNTISSSWYARPTNCTTVTYLPGILQLQWLSQDVLQNTIHSSRNWNAQILVSLAIRGSNAFYCALIFHAQSFSIGRVTPKDIPIICSNKHFLLNEQSHTWNLFWPPGGLPNMHQEIWWSKHREYSQITNSKKIKSTEQLQTNRGWLFVLR
jgi:hypothetical protein